jgi:hypothetical protein
MSERMTSERYQRLALVSSYSPSLRECLAEIAACWAEIEAAQARLTAVHELHVMLAAARRECEELRVERDRMQAEWEWLTTLKPKSEWSDDWGDVLWWRVPVVEPPFYQGSPLDTDWCDVEADVTHWTPIPNPRNPNADYAARGLKRKADELLQSSAAQAETIMGLLKERDELQARLREQEQLWQAKNRTLRDELTALRARIAMHLGIPIDIALQGMKP